MELSCDAHNAPLRFVPDKEDTAIGVTMGRAERWLRGHGAEDIKQERDTRAGDEEVRERKAGPCQRVIYLEGS